MDQVLRSIFESVLEGDRVAAAKNVEEALVANLKAEQILNDALIGAMTEVGVRFEDGVLYVPEMLASARAMQAGLGVIRPRLIAESVKVAGRVLIGTVKGDMHDIGKNLVGMMLEGAGFEVIDLGTDVPPERFAATAREKGIQLIGLSALLTTTMVNMRSTIEAFEDLGIREKVKIMVGGAPVTETFAKEIKADGYAPDATRAVALAKSMMVQEVS